VAGEALTDLLLRLLEERGTPVRPAYTVKRRAQGDSPAVLLDFPLTHPSFARYAQRVRPARWGRRAGLTRAQEAVRDLKETLCRVSEAEFDERHAPRAVLPLPPPC
jgi:hypothetical protein